MTGCTKYCRHEHNLATGCTTLQLGTPQLYRRSESRVQRTDTSLLVDPDESKFLVLGESAVRGVEVHLKSGGRLGVSVGEGGEMSYSSITQERLPNFFMYCVATASQPNMETAKSLDRDYDDWFQIEDMDAFVDMIQEDVHRETIRKLKLPRKDDFGVLEIRGPVHYYGEGTESDMANTATITFLTDNGQYKCSGSQILQSLTEHDARTNRVGENHIVSHIQGNPIWDAFWKHPQYKCLSEYRVASFLAADSSSELDEY